MEPVRPSNGEPSSSRPVTAERLDLQPHPEGGWFRRSWTSPAGTDGGRPAASATHVLLVPGERSAPRVVDAGELWSGTAAVVTPPFSWDGCRLDRHPADGGEPLAEG